MGGRGAAFRGGGGSYNPKRDNSEVVLANNAVGVTEKVYNSLGEENVRDAIAYIQDAITFLTGDPDYMKLTIDASASGNAYAHMALFTGQMGVNTKFFKENLEALSKQYARDVSAGFHPKNTGMTDVFVHEAAHRIDALIAQNKNMSTLASTVIVPEAIKNLRAQGMKGNSYAIQTQLSGYGASFYNNHTGDKYAETFAEALSDYNKNKGRANPLSREIARVMKKYM